MLTLARWSSDHRRAVVALWLVVLTAAMGISHAVGSHYSNDFSLPGTDAHRAAVLLSTRFRAESGDSGQIVLHTPRGTLATPAVRARVERMLSRVARLPRVTSVTSPYAAGSRAISKDGTIGFATVAFGRRAKLLPAGATKKVITEATAPRSASLQVELSGQAFGQAQRGSIGLTAVVGIGAAIVVLVISFGSMLAMGLPIVTALLGLGTGFGLVELMSWVLTMPDFSTQLALMIGLGVGVDYALFIVTRYREAYHRNGGDVRAAVAEAMDTAGRAVIFAGATVVIALMGMFALGVGFLYGLAISSSVAVLLVLAASLTLLPALLTFFGRRIGRPSLRARRRKTPQQDRSSFWPRWIATIQHRPWLAVIASATIMLVLAAPALSLRLGNTDAGNDPKGQTTRKAYDLLAQGFGKGFNGPLLVAVRLPRPGDTAALAQLTSALRRTPGVAAVAQPQLSPKRDAATIAAFPVTSPQSTQTESLVRRLRRDVIPPIEQATGAAAYIGGATAAQIDFASVLAGKLWLFVGVVVLVSALLLMVVFRSLLIPLQAAAMNLLSIGASMGIVVAVFQWGWLESLFGIAGGPIAAFLPVMVFAIVFGLSMDYEVFLVSRIHEEWTHGADNSTAVREGLIRTGRVITAAAAVMVAVFASFILGGERVIELFGLALASAVFLDALVIRCILLPAVLQLLGDRTWWFPAWFDRRLPRFAIEPDQQRRPAASPRGAARRAGSRRRGPSVSRGS
jgi:RND superfamily putative drug exporter